MYINAGLADALGMGIDDIRDVGKKFICPYSFVGK